MLSIIIPTFNERENVITITERIAEVMQNRPYEIIFVDDSRDETPEILEKLARQNDRVRYEHRVNERGLGTAVVRGFQLAKGDTITVMDADLQHPPEMLIPMINAIDSGCEIVIPSRFIPGGDDGGLNFVRKLISATARYIGKIMLKSVRSINDPTSGFFMFKSFVIEGADLKPIGWKILIEILAKGTYTNIIEIPYQFHARAAGESKMSLKEQWNYLEHLFTLVKNSPEDRRFFIFALVGISGVMVNLIFYSMFIHWLHLGVVTSGFLSACVAMMSNFFFNDQFTWQDVQNNDSLIKRAFKFVTTSVVGILINTTVLYVLFHALHFHYFISNLCGIVCGTVWNYTINNAWTWNKKVAAKSVHITKWTPAQMREYKF